VTKAAEHELAAFVATTERERSKIMGASGWDEYNKARFLGTVASARRDIGDLDGTLALLRDAERRRHGASWPSATARCR
jgi:hypothetical protein